MEKEKMYKCQICGELIKPGNAWHGKKCREAYINNLTEEKKEEIYRLYVEEKTSLVQLSIILGLSYSQLQHILPEIGITLRNIKEACNTPKKKELYEKTMMEHFGTKHNFDKNCSSRKKWEKRLFEEEGITNVFQRKEVIDKIKKTMKTKYTDEEIYWNHVKGGNLDFLIKKYGKIDGTKKYNEICFNKGKSNRYQHYIETYGEEEGLKKWKKRIDNLSKNLHNNYGLNEKAYKILDEENIKHEQEYVLNYIDNNNISRRFLYDIKVGRLLIELNGIYWHCSPKKYKPNDKVLFPNGKEILAKDKWEYDAFKSKIAIDNGFKIVTIWEDEFSKEKLLKTLKEYNYGNC